MAQKSVSILIIEDNPVNAAQLINFTSIITNDIAMSTSAERGFLMFTQAQHTDDSYQILITDINLPGMSGKALIQEIREKEKDSPPATHLKIIAISADPPADHLLDACRKGAGCYLEKPIRKEELLEALRNTGLFDQ